MSLSTFKNCLMKKRNLNNIYNVVRHFRARVSHNLSSDINLEKLIEDYQDKIIFSSYVENTKIKLGYARNKILYSKIERRINKSFENDKAIPFPVTLKYILEPELQNLKSPTENEIIGEEINRSNTYFPYTNIGKEYENYRTNEDTSKNIVNNESTDSVTRVNNNTESTRTISVNDHRVKNWMSDYETFSDDLEDDINNSAHYGTPDPNHRKMGPPCGGCGALLNCISTNMPGYLPSELYKGKSEKILKGVICQRCHFLKNYNIALNVTVGPNYYNSLLASLKDKFGLIVLLVDLLDFPCCIWPGLVELIGSSRPVLVVGNKVDLIPKDSKQYLNHIKNCLEEAVIQAGFEKKDIKSVSLVSAATGYGVEELISTLYNVWGTKGDVFIVGCTNVGKSTIFNALLGSDYCKVQATDLIQRATASPWPGTTLKMLRFPILRPSGLRMLMRKQRLQHDLQQGKAEKELMRIQSQENHKSHPITLMGHIGTTFRTMLAEESNNDPYSMSLSSRPQENQVIGIDEKNREFKESKWCYDTPGVMHNNQILDLLTTDEILSTLPQKTLKIKNFCVQPGMSLLLAGLGRVDYIEGDKSIRLSVFASEHLPIVICKLTDVDDIYETFLGTPVLGVPEGSDERLKQWPGLKESEHITNVIGEHGAKAVADLLLSSAGWVSVTPFPNERAVLRHYTVEGRGAFVRTPPLILYGSAVRGARIRHSPAYKIVTNWSRQKGQIY